MTVRRIYETHLNTNIFVPKNAGKPLPIILERTPYNAPESARGWAQGKYAALVAGGYIFVFQDIRGRYKSEGQFVMQRAPVSCSAKKAIRRSPILWMKSPTLTTPSSG